MTRDEKGAVIADLHEKFARAKVAILTESSGLPVTQVSQLRKQLRGAGAELCVIKNTMAAEDPQGIYPGRKA
jgi:large subunit ribosomal protein L7/L12